MSWGWEFEVTKDCTVDQLGWYENVYGDPGSYMAVRIWDDTGTVIANIASPAMPGTNNWGWGTLATPVDLYTGTTYMVGAYTYDAFGWGWMCGLPDSQVPDETPDGIVQVGNPKYAVEFPG
jgi:hypothetical protein